MIIKTSQKEPQIFFCKFCDYKTSKLSNFNRHNLTLKHKMIKNDNQKEPKGAKNNYECELCNKSYKFLSGLSRHKKICFKTTDMILVNKEKHLDAITKANLYNNQNEDINNLKNAIKKLSTQDKSQQKIINNTNNLNINIILNDYCKDAMNLTQFVDQIKLSLEDLFYTKKKGYIEGMSNIFIKNLNELKPTERPIHCSNKNNNILYIKDDNKWEKDCDFKLTQGINDITKKQIIKLKEWEQDNPDWQNSEKLTEIYMKLVHQIIGSSNGIETEKNNNLIIKKISKNVKINDINFNCKENNQNII